MFEFSCRLRNVLLPTLVSCCYESQENKAAIEQEISSALLVSFIEVTTYNIELTTHMMSQVFAIFYVVSLKTIRVVMSL